ncbi:hypothetical protein [Propionivibrio sp.]|uniref:hypothetical protein n=1 Tax=Propionivibrio sp. TaxID=2212460 RepID=UPI003BF44BDB
MRVKLLAALISLVCANAFGAVVDDIKALMEENKFAEAYQLGKQNPDLLGDPLFDFYYGIAALDAGAPGEGVLALERYSLTYPDNTNARFNLARGYYILGEDQRARDEFDGLRGDASGEQLAAIERYLDAIRARESRYQPTANLWLEAGGGYDSNIISGVNNNSLVSIPGLGSFTPISNSVAVKESDGFYSYAGGVQGTLPVSPGVALFGSASFDARNYFKSNNDQFDQLNYGATGGVSYLTGKNLFRGGVAVQQQTVYRQNYLLTYGLTGEWTHQFDQFNRFNLGAFYGRQDFSNMDVYALKDKSDAKQNSGSEVRTADNWGIAGGWTHVFGMTWQPVLSLSAGYGREDNTKDRPDYTRDIYTARAQVSLTPAPRWGASIGASYLQSDYQGNFGMFPTSEPRRDHGNSVDAVVSYRIDKFWSVRGEAQWTTQDSNVGLFDYSRTAAAAKIRYEFN